MDVGYSISIATWDGKNYTSKEEKLMHLDYKNASVPLPGNKMFITLYKDDIILFHAHASAKDTYIKWWKHKDKSQKRYLGPTALANMVLPYTFRKSKGTIFEMVREIIDQSLLKISERKRKRVEEYVAKTSLQGILEQYLETEVIFKESQNVTDSNTSI